MSAVRCPCILKTLTSFSSLGLSPLEVATADHLFCKVFWQDYMLDALSDANELGSGNVREGGKEGRKEW